MNGTLQRLRAELAADRVAFRAQLAELEGLDLSGDDPDPGDVARVAVALHGAYSAVEALLARVMKHLDGSIPEGREWHRELLAAAALDVPEVRPALVSGPVVSELKRLLGFRHFFRHAYAVALDPAQLVALQESARRVAPGLDADLDRLDAFLAALAAAT